MTSEIISTKKRKFIEILKKTLNPNKSKTNEIAKEIGISLPTYYRWLRDEKLLKIAEQEKAVDFKKRMPEVMEKLVKKAKDGDIKAIKIYLDIFYNFIKDKNDEEILTPDKAIDIIRTLKKEKNDKENKI